MYPLPYTTYIADCCAELERQSEYDSDRFLVTMVRLHRFLGRIYAVFPNPDIDNSTPCDFHASQHMTMSLIRSELEALKADTPRDIQSNCTCRIREHQHHPLSTYSRPVRRHLPEHPHALV